MTACFLGDYVTISLGQVAVDVVCPQKTLRVLDQAPMRRGLAMGPRPGTRLTPTSQCDRIGRSRLAKCRSQAGAILLPDPVARPRIEAMLTTGERLNLAIASPSGCIPSAPAGMLIESLMFLRTS
jgi:hypothetical protein